MQNITTSHATLRYAFGIALIGIGLDKVFQTNIITTWVKYVSPLAQTVLPIDPTKLVLILGVVEIIVGIMFFTRWCKAAAYLAIIALLAIIVNLFSLHDYDIALRDALLAITLLTFTWITDEVNMPKMRTRAA